MKASLSTYHQSPRKVRLVATLVRGRPVPEALAILTFLPKRAAGPLHKLVTSAVRNTTLPPESLRVASLTVDKGQVYRRHRARARGRAAGINKRTSHVNVVLAPIVVNNQ